MARQKTAPDTRAIAATGAVATGAAAAAAAKVRARRRKRARQFQLAEGESTGAGVRRIVRGQLDDVADGLDVTDEQSVHAARKSFKRLRAVVRLTRDQLGDAPRRRENAAFRDAGRELSSARDARVLVDTLDKLDPEGFADLRSALVADYDRATDAAGRPDEAAVRTAVRDARGRVGRWRLNGNGTAGLASGLARMQRRGRRAYKAAKKDSSTEHLHELRKRTKDLWHAAEILRSADPKRMDRLAKDAHKLADLLGDDHDLATLGEAAERHRATLTPDELARLDALITESRGHLQGKALRRARKLYATKPRKLAKTLTTG
jgi:CHAD domain-containing protein